MLNGEEVARRTQARCWPIICDTSRSHEDRVMAFLEMTATLATYCSYEEDGVIETMRANILDRSDSVIDGVNSLHIIADAMANGIDLKESKRKDKR